MPRTKTPLPNDSKITIELPERQREAFNKYCKQTGTNANARLRMHIGLDLLAAKKVRIVKSKKEAV